MEALRRDSGPPAFYLFVKPFVFVGEGLLDSDLLARALPFGAALLLFVAALFLPRGGGRRIYLLLAASSTLTNLYAAEARAYALLSLFSLLLFLLALRGAEGTRQWIALAALAALALYTHYLALFTIAGLVLLAALRGRARTLFALLAGAVLFAPWLPVLFAQPPAALSWTRESPGGSIAGFLSTLGGVGRIPDPFGPPLPNALFSAAIGLGAFLLLALLSAARKEREIREGLILVAFVLSAVLLLTRWRNIAFAGRTEMAILPVWLAVVARAACGSRAVRWAAFLSAALGLSATVIIAASPHPPFAPSVLTARLSRVARGGDLLFASPSAYLPARLAADRGDLDARVTAFPSGSAEHPGWFRLVAPSEEDYRTLERAMESARAGQRIFLLLHDAYRSGRLEQTLITRGETRELWRLQEFSVLSWSRIARGTESFPSRHRMRRIIPLSARSPAATFRKRGGPSLPS